MEVPDLGTLTPLMERTRGGREIAIDLSFDRQTDRCDLFG
jgi:hypothetical protein